MENSELPSSVLSDLDLALQCPLFHDIPDANTTATTEDWPALSPMERWRNSPPELEAPHLAGIIGPVAQADGQSLQPASESSPFSQHHDQTRSHCTTPSVASSESAGSSAASTSSVSSAHSFGSDPSAPFGRFYVKGASRRRRRRRRKTSPVPHGRPGQRPKQRRPYQCTFCTDTFKSKYDWTRHEKTLHLSLESWVCASSGPVYEEECTSALRCVFCDVDNPSEGHIRDHRFWECREKPSPLRTFYRKDHLYQHLRLVHGVEHVGNQAEAWKTEVTRVNSRCGFCEETFTRWSDRNDHLAAHFRNGASMKDWKGCRGLDPAVALAVDNSMPPYLIGIESAGVDPFRASRQGEDSGNGSANRRPCNGSSSQRQGNIQPTPFELLTEHLVRFVRREQAAGVLVTDESIQQEARCLMYGDDDPWNQTAADNLDWLKLFKEGLGLPSPTPMMNADSTNTSSNSVFPLPWTTNTTASREVQEPNGIFSGPRGCR